MITGIIFSRDRALQLDGTLASLFLQGQGLQMLELHVLYKATTATHRRHYAELSSAYAQRGVQFHAQTEFRTDVLGILTPGLAAHPPMLGHWLAVRLARRLGFASRRSSHSSGAPQVLFLVDDNLFVGTFHLDEMARLLEGHPDALGVSFRLGLNTTQCYVRNKPQPVPTLVWSSDKFIKFRWTTAQDDFAYPLEVSSSLYRQTDVLYFLSRVPFSNPNQLEDQLARYAPAFRHVRPHLLCPRQSVAFCNPVNIVQTDFANRVGSQAAYSSDQLAQLFEQGQRIDVDVYAGFVPRACHQEVELKFAARGSHG